MEDKAKQFTEFKEWYDAQWLGDGEHGQAIPSCHDDSKFNEYVDGYTLALGAWIAATSFERAACAEVCDKVGIEYHDAVSVECGRRIRAR